MNNHWRWGCTLSDSHGQTPYKILKFIIAIKSQLQTLGSWEFPLKTKLRGIKSKSVVWNFVSRKFHKFQNDATDWGVLEYFLPLSMKKKSRKLLTIVISKLFELSQNDLQDKFVNVFSVINTALLRNLMMYTLRPYMNTSQSLHSPG